MRRKLLLLGAVLAMCGMPLTSCHKDEPTPMDVAMKDVAGTEWLGYFDYTSFTLYFYRDGKYSMVDNYGGFADGTYTQNGKRITFNETKHFGFFFSFSYGEMNTPGIMSIQMSRTSGTKSAKVDFALNVLK